MKKEEQIMKIFKNIDKFVFESSDVQFLQTEIKYCSRAIFPKIFKFSVQHILLMTYI